MNIHLEGRARVFGDDVNTDYIIASSRKRDTLDPQVLRRYLMEAVDPAFAASVQAGDLVVAGTNFGCGSAMEVAVTVVLGAGIPAVLARSFSRTYYRNAINNGLIPVECDTMGVGEGDRLIIDLDDDGVRVQNETTGHLQEARLMPPVMLEILSSGGLVPYIRRHEGFRVS